MKKILPFVLICGGYTRLGKSPDRVTPWVHALIGCYMMVKSRPGTPVMMLLMPCVPLYQFCQRWEHYTYALYPKIHLVMRSLLQAGEGKRFKVFSPNSFSSKSDKNYGLIKGEPEDHKQHEINTLVREFAMPPGPAGTIRQTPLRQVFMSVDQGRALISGGQKRTMDQHENVTRISPFISEDGQQIVRRIKKGGQRLAVVSGGRRPDLFEGSHHIQGQIIHGRKRIETMAYKNAGGTLAHSALSGRPAMVVARKQQDPASEKSGETEWNLPYKGRAIVQKEQTTSQPVLNVEQIAEDVIRKIDYRLRAYRERRGKPF